MQYNIATERLRLIAHLVPNPYDNSISKRTFEWHCTHYRICGRATVQELAFLEFGIDYDEEQALFYMESLCSLPLEPVASTEFLRALSTEFLEALLDYLQQ
jgi:hypothetical protein